MAAPDGLVDLVSDTATRPRPGMLQAMAEAPLGDEQLREDPTVNRLQQRVAALLGTEAALLVPTATMANQIALALHTRAGDEVVCHAGCHVFNHETGGAAMNARVQLHPVEGEHGWFTADTIRSVLRADDPHFPVTRVVAIENTANRGGGSVWPDEVFDPVADLCDELGLALHIDGARIMNAAVAADVPPARWGARATTVQMCFSKGLGCPFGAVLALPDELFWRARRLKQALGGALRQAGVVAGAMLYALDHHVEGLADDHARARRLAEGLGALDGITAEPVPSNLVYFGMERDDLTVAELRERMLARGVRVGVVGPNRLRACTHLDITDEDIDQALRAAADGLG